MSISHPKDIQNIYGDKNPEKTGHPIFTNSIPSDFPIPFCNEVHKQQNSNRQHKIDRKWGGNHGRNQQPVSNFKMNLLIEHRSIYLFGLQ